MSQEIFDSLVSDTDINTNIFFLLQHLFNESLLSDSLNNTQGPLCENANNNFSLTQASNFNNALDIAIDFNNIKHPSDDNAKKLLQEILDLLIFTNNAFFLFNVKYVNKDSEKIKNQNSELELEIGFGDKSVTLELESGLIFTNWLEFKTWINNFAKKEEFDYKVQTSQIDEE
ncbi:5795_t:CDS:2, partial [Cetraspora pellucida]